MVMKKALKRLVSSSPVLEQIAADEDYITSPLSTVIDIDGFTPRLLALLSNALVWRESHLLRQEFNLGTNDWRVISTLAIRPGITATDVSEFVGMNKAVVSKAVSTLVERNLIVAKDGPRGSRPLYLTHAGAEIHDAMLPISLSGEEILLEGLSKKEIAQITQLLQQLLKNADRLNPTPVVDIQISQ